MPAARGWMKRSAKRPVVVQVKHSRDQHNHRSLTYQLELVLCGKAKCRKRHGPYWYAYWKSGNRTRKRYVGKKFRKLDQAEIVAREVFGAAADAVLGNPSSVAELEGLPKTSRRRRRAVAE